MKKIDYYRKLLSVTKADDLQALKTAYRNLMKTFHPDKFQDNEAEKLDAEKRSKKIIEAYHFLVSIAPETINASIEQYNETINNASIDDYEFKDEMLTIKFNDGNTYEYFGVPKSAYIKMVNAPSLARFARRHICTVYTYRSVSKLVAA